MEYVDKEQSDEALEKLKNFVNSKAEKKNEKKELLDGLRALEARSENSEWVDFMYNELLDTHILLGKTIQTIDTVLNLVLVIEPETKTSPEQHYLSFKDENGNEHRIKISKEEDDAIMKFHFIKRTYPSLDEVKSLTPKNKKTK